MSLLNYGEMHKYCFYCLFASFAGDVSNLYIPTPTAADCYNYMFHFAKITVAPELPATTLIDSCYYRMFADCTELITGPSKLPALHLKPYCYYDMFDGCEKLERGPEIYSTEPNNEHYYDNMFLDCYNLNYLKVNYRNWTGIPPLIRVTMAYEPTFTGTLVVPPGVSAPSWLPDHWVIDNDKITIEKTTVTCKKNQNISEPIQIKATQKYGTDEISFSTTSELPSGLSLSNTGLITGKPLVYGTYPIIVNAEVVNSTALPDSATINFVINGENIAEKLILTAEIVKQLKEKATTDFSKVTAENYDVLSGKLFYDNDGNLVEGTSLPTDFSKVTAEKYEVLKGKMFYTNDGDLVEGTLDVPTDTPTNSADFYLCSYVNRNYFSYNTIVVSGMPTNLFVGATYMDYNTWETKEVPSDIAARDPNGTYTLQNPADNYGYWWWKSENGCIIDKYDMGQPIIYPDENYKRTDKYVMVPMNESTYSAYDYPAPDDYTSYTWQLHDGSTVSGGSAVVPKPAEVEKYWEGYKLVLNDEGKYDLSAEKTKLTYGDYMPVAGRIYDAACTLEITNADLTEDALWACPHGMTSNENDEWKVTSESPIYGGEIFNAFDEDVNTAIHFNYTDKKPYIQWQNKKRPVYLKEIYGVPGGGDYGYAWDSYKFYILGSNDGETWEQLFYGNWSEDGNWSEIGRSDLPKRKIILEQPHDMFFCYRIIKDTTGSGFNIHYLQAFCQSSREVPK